jgi:hypothetical protein
MYVITVEASVVEFLRSLTLKYDKQDQQGKAAFNERNPHMTQQQEPVQGAQANPKQKQDRAKTEHGQVNH